VMQPLELFWKVVMKVNLLKLVLFS
jgi:hypothetical protein